ncbi:MAG: TetR/AcrR family transcriptional regulator [Acidimicrobiales bacterium]|nr:TetR/AcrR family transcriptional regulator [Acidimicrobiales bacterium]
MGALLTIDVNRTSGPASETDDRVREATLSCIARFGLTKTTLDDIARESGVSRATIYRTFPGGRDVLLESVVSAEIARFFANLDARISQLDDLEDLVTVGLAASMRFLSEHAALRTIVQIEPGLLLPMFAFHRLDVALSQAAAFAAPHLEPHLGSADAAWSAAEHLTRIVLTYTMHPDPAVDPTDDASIRRLVRHLVLPGISADPTVHDTKESP